MGNITGTPFLPEVTAQIEKRQEFLGQNPKQDKHIIYQNNKSAFLRMASSIYIKDQYKVAGATFNTSDEAKLFLEQGIQAKKLDSTAKIEKVFAENILKQRGISGLFTGDSLAKSAVLFGGVNGLSVTTNNPYFPSGVKNIGSDDSLLNSLESAYGWGGLQQGYRPMPGINSADISYYNRGALQKVSISCKVFTVEQLQVFDLLYFRIGYSMLLEWGHNIYIDNKGDLQNRTDYFTEPFNLFFGIGNTKVDNSISKQNQILQAIKNERAKSAYNYDAMLGKITNFSWKFNTDGSYDITLNLIGLGDVIESLRVNQAISIPGAPKSPSVAIADEGRTIANAQQAAEQAIAAQRNSLASKQSALGEEQGKAGKSQEEKNTQWSKEYGRIPAWQQLAFFASPPQDEEKANDIELQWNKFKDRASVSKIASDELTGDGKRVNVKLSDGTNKNIGEDVPFDNWPTHFIVLREKEDGSGFYIDNERSEPKLINDAKSGLLVYQDYREGIENLIKTGQTGYKKYDGGHYTLTSYGSFYEFSVYGLTPWYLSIYNFLNGLARDIEKTNNKNKELEGAGAKLDAESTALDAKEKAQEQYYRNLTRAVEAKKERQELAPESAKESAGKTKLNAVLWGWIDLLNQKNTDESQNTIIRDNFKKVEYKSKSMNSGETGVSEHQFTQYYVRFGYFLDWITNNLLYYDIAPIVKTQGTGNPEIGSFDFTQQTQAQKEATLQQQQANNNPNPQNNSTQPNTQQRQTNLYLNKIAPLPGNAVPLFTIDTNPETNFCLAWRFQISSDPFVCLIPMDGKDSKGNGWKFFTEKDTVNLSSYFASIPDVNNPKKVIRNPFKGKIMNLYVNIDFLAKRLTGNVDVNGKVNLLNYLNDVCNNINDTLGNVNKLQAIYDAEENQIKIIDDNILKREVDDTPKVATFESFGVQLPDLYNEVNGSSITTQGKGSFLRDVSFQVQLPPNMAAMATISAQAKGNIVGENATGLSKLNDCLLDRVITYKLDAESLGAKVKGQSDSPEVIFQENMRKMYSILKELYTDFLYQKDNVDTLRSINRDVSLYVMGEYAEKEIAPAPFFIPFNLSLDMDGLAGMVNYQRFAIQEAILPYSYRPASRAAGVTVNPKLDFLIKGITHKISQNQWTTKIDSLSVSATGQPRTTSYNLDQEQLIDLEFLGNTAIQPPASSNQDENV